ncbi:MAG TPA: HAD family hydrolase [Bryobacteraceae bacterium]|nr:HAD family hydrolase [Bryobacteraceae bacterium]
MTETQPSIERIRASASARNTRVCIFDFDGTISVIRSGWMDVMTPMMVEILAGLNTGESEDQLRAIVREYIGRLTGGQTIYQMIELADQVKKRGGIPLDPTVYKEMFVERLNAITRTRVDALRNHTAPPDKYRVPGVYDLAIALRERGIKLYLISGTDQELVRQESVLLGMAPLFEGRIYGALDNYEAYSKKIMIDRIIAQENFRGEEFLGFGDGQIEIEDIRAVGGVAVGVATDEPDCLVVDEWKRQRLIAAGADFIIPNYLHRDALLEILFDAQ